MHPPPYRRKAALTALLASLAPVGTSAFSAVRRASTVTSMSAAAAADPISPDPDPEAGDVAAASRSLGLFARTPLVPSAPLTELCSGRRVFLKLDALQASGSFKDRGMAHLCHTLRSEQGIGRLISSSGGNAGLAVATVAPRLDMEVSVVVPETTKALVVGRLRRLGADVTVHGANWNEADALARERADADDEAAYVSPYDNPLLWTGHSTVVDEVREQLAEEGVGGAPAAIVASVGGGGLLCGIFEGMERHSWDGAGAAVIAAETVGAASFGRALETGAVVRLSSIDSVATSLGALEVTEVALSRTAGHRGRGGSVSSSLCTDAEAVGACVRFAEDHRMLIEPACGAALAALYSDRLREELLAAIPPEGPIVVEVCGGSGVNLDLLAAWKEEFLS